MGVGKGSGRDHLRQMSGAQALADYEAARHRLPQAPPPGTPQMAASLDEIAERYDAFLLDAFGVLNIGEDAIPGVPDRVAGLQAAGKRVLVVSNAASVTRAALIKKYAALGYRFTTEDIITSRSVALCALASEPRRHWGVMATEALQGDDLGGIQHSYLGDDQAVYDSVDGFLFLGSGDWTERRQDLIRTALNSARCPLWVGNPDIVAPRDDGFSIEPGFYAHQLADQTSVVPRFFGKPFAAIFDHALAHLGADIARDRILMVGDSLHTDILGAAHYGLASALIAGYGFFAGRSAHDAIAETGITPTYILDRP